MTINDIKAEKIVNELREIAAFIRSHDKSYERELQQVFEIEQRIANLVRYANAIQERITEQQQN